LAVFVYEDERKESISLFKRNALEGSDKRGYREIIEELQDRLRKELGNYYLLFYQGGEIKDFDFVSKFEYYLKDAQNKQWQVEDLFACNFSPIVSNVFDFERSILPVILNNALIVKTKTVSILFKYFDDIAPKYCKTSNTYLLVLKYRKALYDFIYKSNRTGFTQNAFLDILLTGILDDIKLDRYEGRQHTEDRNIRQKLNILFSLYHNFQPFKQDSHLMPTQILELRQNFDSLATGESSLTSDEQFTFAAGQVIYYILSKSKSADKSYSRLEPFLQLNDAERLKQAILKIFNTYKHERFSKRFSNPFAQVMAYNTTANLKDLMPLMLAGYFSTNQLFGKGQDEENSETE
jgi:CRISPR-associated protein Csh1